MLIAEATVETGRADAASLHQLQARIADRLEQVGRRDQLTVTWTPAQGADGHTRGHADD